MVIDISQTISPLEVVCTFISVITFLIFGMLFALALSDQRIVLNLTPDQIDRIVASNAVLNEGLRWIIGTSMLMIWISGLLTPESRAPNPSEHVSMVGLALITMVPFMQVLLLVWGVKDLILRRRLLHSGHTDTASRTPIAIPPDIPPGASH